MIASCCFLEDELRQCSKEEGLTFTDSVETLGVDLRRSVKRLRTKEKARRKNCKVSSADHQEEQGFPEELHEDGCQEVATSGYGGSEDVESACSLFGPFRNIEIEEADGSSSGQEEYNLVGFGSWKSLASKWRRSSPFWPLSTGQKGRGLANGT